MPLIFPGISTSQQLFGATLRSEKFGNPKLASATEVMAYLGGVRDWAAKANYRTAQSIITVVEKALEKEVYVVGMKNGGFTCFCSDDPQRGKGVVFFDMKASYSLKVPDGVDATTRDPKYKADKVELHPYIAFLHEFGHAKQWIENPYLFDGNVSTTRNNESKLVEVPWFKKEFQKDLQTKIKDMAYAKAVKSAQKSAPPAAIVPASGPAGAQSGPPGPPGAPPPAPPPTAMGSVKRATINAQVDKDLKLQATRVTNPQWAVRIETDNLIRHEWPMCVEAGYPKRNYSEIEISIS